MELLRDYFLCAIGASVITGLTENIVAENIRTFVRFISGLFIVLMLAAPAVSVIRNIDIPYISDNTKTDIPGNAEAEEGEHLNGYEGLLSEYKRTVIRSVREFVALKTGMSEESISVEAVLDTSEADIIKIRSLNITIYEEYDTKLINDMVYLTYLCETETEYKEYEPDNR